MKVHVLGGGKSVGCSCIMLESENDAIVLDCGFNRARPEQSIDFNKIQQCRNKLRCVCISHYHVDHVGMLPMLTKFF
ncbi:Metallo-beta-lactamase domain-containing protein [Entamoeba marina]